MKPNNPADYVTIPRLVEYYRGGRVVGWGDAIPEEFRLKGPGGYSRDPVTRPAARYGKSA
jgi:hypothetical protein